MMTKGTAWKGVAGIIASGEHLLHSKSAPDNCLKKKKKKLEIQTFWSFPICKCLKCLKMQCEQNTFLNQKQAKRCHVLPFRRRMLWVPPVPQWEFITWERRQQKEGRRRLKTNFFLVQNVVFISHPLLFSFYTAEIGSQHPKFRNEPKLSSMILCLFPH